jgi:hypothetical protein
MTEKGTEDNRHFSFFGMVDARVHKFFLVRIKRNDTAYHNGDVQLQDEIFFQGKWRTGAHHGGFTLIRYMPEAAVPESDPPAERAEIP